LESGFYSFHHRLDDVQKHFGPDGKRDVKRLAQVFTTTYNNSLPEYNIVTRVIGNGLGRAIIRFIFNLMISLDAARPNFYDGKAHSGMKS